MNNSGIGKQTLLWGKTPKEFQMEEYLHSSYAIYPCRKKAWSKEPEIKSRSKAILERWNKLANTIGAFELARVDEWFEQYG
ncbi:MAG: hypothetical protein OXC92_01890 [Flavobacteriaceae bacterium]|nr:hypothetical protein [Flavobacteriaceae bacterium]